MVDTIVDFTLPSYMELIDSLVARGYRVCDYPAAYPEARDLILRHDVDFDLEAAVTLARAEASRGWRSTYFILTRSEFYNPNSPRSRDALRILGDLGHEVGLHFDAALYRDDSVVLAGAAGDEAAALSGWAGARVRTFSLHRPNPALLVGDFAVPGLINAYAPRFFREMGYCSDSRGAWRFGRPEGNAAVREGRGLQLLTHPIWWTSDRGPQPSPKVAAFLARRARLLSDEAAAHCLAYVPSADR